MLVDDVTLPRALALDWESAGLTAADRAMLVFALKLTRTPWSMDRSDTETLKAAGFDDTAVLDITQVTAYFNYVNRMADGLGVELEPYWTRDDLTLTREEFLARKRARGRRAGEAPGPAGEVEARP